MNIAIYSELIDGKDIYGVSARNNHGQRFVLTEPIFENRVDAEKQQFNFLAFANFVTNEKTDMLEYSIKEIRKNTIGS